jgi:NAD(P)-dependent dehydrogenase (short-subunit alcohol dehydrogenase family)
MTLSGRGAVVTGGGRGIGAAVARALAGAGARVLVAARHMDEVEAVALQLRHAGHQAWATHCDVTDAGHVAALARTAHERLGMADILVNNAGASSSASVPRIMLEEWQRLFAVNATSTLLATQAFLPGMLERGWGRIVNVASIAGLEGDKYIAAYSAAKHAVIGFTKSLAAEVAGKGVTANAVCPGYVDTPMTDESLTRIMERTKMTREAALAAVLSHVGQPRLVTVDEVAATVLALAGDAAATLNGQTIILDAGALRV